MIKLFPHQSDALEETKEFNRVAYYHDMGLGKTFTGAEKMHELGARVNLIICQKSKVDDWVDHFKKYYWDDTNICDLTTWKFTEFDKMLKTATTCRAWDKCYLIINYELAFRRPELRKLEHFTLMLDESSLIQNETAKRSKFVLGLKPDNVILLSGTPTGGKYENLWSQLSLLGWKISKELFDNQYVAYHYDDSEGFPVKIIDGYKNEERLKKKMRRYGCHFLKTEEVFDLPEQIHNTIKVNAPAIYRKFRKDSVVRIPKPIKPAVFMNDPVMESLEPDYIEVVGDTTLTKMLYERQLCGHYNAEKLQAFRDLIESTNDRLIVFYSFNAELDSLCEIASEYTNHISIVNGHVKNLGYYEKFDDSITFIQYQAGAMGLNLQKANKIIYFTPPLSSELFEQSKKRTHRIGQEKTCFYYYLTCRNSVEEKIYKTLAMRKDYTDALFERGE